MELGLPGTLGVFLASGTLIILAAVMLARAGDVIASGTGWGGLSVGAMLIAGATSLPELVTNVAAVRIDAPSLAAGDILGANMMNMCTLAIMLALWGGRQVFQRLSSRHVQVALFALGMTSLATLLAVLRLEAKWLMISPALVVIIGSYLVGLRILLRRGEGVEESDTGVVASRSLRWGWAVFALSAAAIFVAGPFLASTAQRLSELTGIAQSFIGVLGVALVTTLPELTATAAALRIGARDQAIAGMYGTNVFNVAVLGIADLFYTQGSLFGSLDWSHVTAGLFAVLLTSLGMAQLVLRRRQRRFSLTEPSTATMVTLYLLGLFLVYYTG